MSRFKDAYDIKACFDKIGHKWLMDNIIVDKRMLEQWLMVNELWVMGCIASSWLFYN
ncbi:hypothetical protein BCU22_022540 (plasmid) [Vibrio cyclitrophicus]|uniref:hypothetical protein n=1 Tax=Vibrio cyclitrophicus TaxID=47951 RepID=UPI0039B0019B